MILSDRQLLLWARSNVTPYDPTCVNAASLDLRLSNEYIRLETGRRHTSEYFVIAPNDAYLVSTLEYIKIPKDVAGMVCLKSSWMRRGLDISSAGFLDPGWKGQITMMLYSHCTVAIRPGERVVQLVLHECFEPEHPY